MDFPLNLPELLFGSPPDNAGIFGNKSSRNLTSTRCLLKFEEINESPVRMQPSMGISRQYLRSLLELAFTSDSKGCFMFSLSLRARESSFPLTDNEKLHRVANLIALREGKPDAKQYYHVFKALTCSAHMYLKFCEDMIYPLKAFNFIFVRTLFQL